MWSCRRTYMAVNAWGRAQVLPHVRFWNGLPVGATSVATCTSPQAFGGSRPMSLLRRNGPVTSGLRMSEIETLTRQALADIAAADSPAAIEALRVALVGKSGTITGQLKQLGKLPAEERKAAGAAINEARDTVSAALGERKQALESAALDARLADETIDVTLPGIDSGRGGLHPVSRTLERIADIFGRLGFELSDGPEIEDDWHNFEALNFPPHHPARAMHDTFYFDDGRLLRTHTSGVQVRYMQDLLATGGQ